MDYDQELLSPIQMNPPLPMPGWICTSKVEQEEMQAAELKVTEAQRVQGPAGQAIGMMIGLSGQPQLEYVAGIVVAIGNYPDELVEERPGIEKLWTPYSIGSKIYFIEDHCRNIKGHAYIHFDRIIAYDPA